MFWGTATAQHVIPQNDWAGDFGPGITVIHPDSATTAFFGDTDFTVATWVRPTNTAASSMQCPYSQYNERDLPEDLPGRKFYFFNDSTRNYAGFNVAKGGQEATVTTESGLGKMLDGNWYRLVGIHKRGVEISLYINNQLVGSVPWTQGVETGSGQQPWLGDLSVGGINYDVNRYWRGQIGPTCYYTRAWASQEIAWDYNSARGRRYSELGQAGTHGASLLNELVAFWEMTEEDTGSGPYVIRRDSHSGGHHLTALQNTHPVSAVGVLPKTQPIADNDRVYQLTDRSLQGNSIFQSDNALRPYWDSQSEVVSIEAGNVFANPSFAGLNGRELSVYFVSIFKESTETEPWFRLCHAGANDTGLKIYREGSTLKLKAWIGGRVQELAYGLSYPAERLLEFHYNRRRLSLWENGQVKASAMATGGFQGPLEHLALGPNQGLKELLIYSKAHQ